MDALQDLLNKVREGFSDWESLGHIFVREKDDLKLFSYTPQATYTGEWNSYERICRGLIIQNSGTLVARPFDKFFNWGERGQYGTGHIVSATEKLDGSLGILYYHNGKHHIATRGSFIGDQAVWATEFLYACYGWQDVPKLPYTLLFEIIYPDNRIVVDYGNREDLFLIGARHIESGKMLPYFGKESLFQLSQDFGFPLPKYYAFNNITQLLEATGQLDENHEGWVVELSDGSRWKFKGDRYIELHRLINTISMKKAILAIGQDDRLPPLPPALQAEWDSLKSEASKKYTELKQRIHMLFEAAPKTTRKEFAKFAVTHNPYTTVLFEKLDNKDYHQSLIKLLLQQEINVS